MDQCMANRLTVVGPAKELRSFSREDKWISEAATRHVELMEHSAQRHAWQFDTSKLPLHFLRTVSRQWPDLTFLLDYDCEDIRLKGLIKARKGRIRHFRVSY